MGCIQEESLNYYSNFSILLLLYLMFGMEQMFASDDSFVTVKESLWVDLQSKGSRYKDVEMLIKKLKLGNKGKRKYEIKRITQNPS